MTYKEALTALGDDRRRDIFEMLRHSRLTVSQLAARQPVSRPAVSQHLKVLSDAGLVRAEVEGTRRYYRVEREGLADLRTWVEGFWDDVLESFASEVDNRMWRDDVEKGSQ